MDNQQLFRQDLREFSKINVGFKEYYDANIENTKDLDLSAIYTELSVWLMDPDYTMDVARTFRNNLPKILKWSLDWFPIDCEIHSARIHQQICIVFAKLVAHDFICKRYVEGFFSEFPFVSPFNDSEDVPSSAKRSKIVGKIFLDSRKFTNFEVMDASFKLLQSNPNFYTTTWKWYKFCSVFNEIKDPADKRLYLDCWSVLVKQFSNPKENQFFQSITKDELNALILRNHFIMLKEHELFVSNISNTSLAPVNNDVLPFHRVSANMVDIEGVSLPIIKTKAPTFTCTPLVLVPTTLATLKRTALLISSGQCKAICLVGPVGCGKTAIVDHMAATLRRPRPIHVQMGDQTDARMLLGLYTSTDVPGEFVWQAGVLTQAVVEGSWILLEDIDSASFDVVTVLAGLLENGQLNVPGYKENVQITPGFQLFLTQRLLPSVTGMHKRQTSAVNFLEKFTLQITVDPLSSYELQKIICASYAPLATISSRIIDAFQSVLDHNTSKPNKTTRPISIRDLFKWCDRSLIDFDVTSKESALKVLHDAIDIFCCGSADREANISSAREIAKYLGVIKETADFYYTLHKPIVTLSEKTFTVGRVTFDLRQDGRAKRPSMPFCFTRPAACLLERIMCCVRSFEPVLLVGETGSGKTSAVQYLAREIGQTLVVINMNQQSDSADLLGGFKPVDLEVIIKPIRVEFENLLRKSFKVEPNKKLFSYLELTFDKKKWSDLVVLMNHSCQGAIKSLKNISDSNLSTKHSETTNRQQKADDLLLEWEKINLKLEKLTNLVKTKSAMAFKFIEGSLVNAVRSGAWVLLDEINLANAETLECLSSLLEGSKGSISLIERGDQNPIERHANFALFACMNPSTDVGKRDLPTGIRSRFTELFLEELTDKTDLLMVTKKYLGAMSLSADKLERIVDLYIQIKIEAGLKLCDGQGQKPHYSLRSLCRALSIASRNPCGGSFQRNIYEACCLSFLTQLNADSYNIVHALIVKYTFADVREQKMIMNQDLVAPRNSSRILYKQIEGYWICCGNIAPEVDDSYILSKSVRRNLADLARVVAIGNLPVLIQGSTSIGKTSLITYLARVTGNKCVRINNHEHTDLQEYIGTYVADDTGKLVFKEGLLVEAMRHGHWIILDELNLAPTDVLEALNRLLDDNRELFLTETQETVKASDRFKLFATQNPPGQYAGRKPLSRAFRNRFAELHWSDIPTVELETILHMRCRIPPSQAKRCVNVMRQLQLLRRDSATFAGKEGFVTLRDLFRWGDRYRLANVGGDEKLMREFYDWDQHMADEGYILLAGRVRKSSERDQIASILSKYLKRNINPQNLYSLCENTSPVTKHILMTLEREKMKHPNIVWTNNMRRLAVHTAKAMQFHEPVLLVGETGCGKTTVCQILANDSDQALTCINCHMHTESSDFIGTALISFDNIQKLQSHFVAGGFIGGLRPVREQKVSDCKKLFEWSDGPLIKAMMDGHIFLADEISLTDDSVLERLNSLLEPQRSLLLAEKGVSDSSNQNNSKQLIVAHKNFHFIGTMNPGGDFGKKELSPALRNRFTEIWCEPCEDRSDLIDIIEHNLIGDISLGNQQSGLSGIGECIVDFVSWLKSTDIGKRLTITIRDILSWVYFINACKDKIAYGEAYIHGALLTFLDALGTGASSVESSTTLSSFHTSCIKFLSDQLLTYHLPPILTLLSPSGITRTTTQFGIYPFLLNISSQNEPSADTILIKNSNFNLSTPTSLYNAQRVLRALCGGRGKPILLEGSPGVGKTSLVVALANESGNKVVRINLSDQTDISDLFGADLPVEGGSGGEFSWRDGPFLHALKSGDWILLDELNLATQSVLEGLNACFDHRGEIYIPELDRTFQVQPNTKLFACQNPLHQGSGRRGLPQSFLNRFTQVHLHALTTADFIHIIRAQFPALPSDLITKMVRFNERLVISSSQFEWGTKGGPWEFNLRDLIRWCEVIMKGTDMMESEQKCYLAAYATASIIYCDRLRTNSDRVYVRNLFEVVFEHSMTGTRPTFYQNSDRVYFGDISVNIQLSSDEADYTVDRGEFVGPKECSLVLRQQCGALRSLLYGIRMGWMTILIGSAGSGKTSVVKTLARLTGKTLYTLPVTSSMDTTDILGGFEQTDYNRHLEQAVKNTKRIIFRLIRQFFNHNDVDTSTQLLRMWEEFRSFIQKVSAKGTMAEETSLFLEKINKLNLILNRIKDDPNVELQDKETVGAIQSQICSLEAKVRVDVSLNAGGKFEWVDSVLVKCLQEGNWLVVDNVNLCNAAVLDRLNGLLEPGGVLTIGERGIDIPTGQMVQITPHKQFRLFFTMDPKNGEISRAMRNRGLEIYILNEKELGRDSQPNNQHDIKSLINLRGLNGNREINCLLTIHKFISDMILGEKPTINQLLLSSFLIHQQLNHGLPIKTVFLETITDIYCRSRSKSDFNNPNHEELIFDLIDKQLSDCSDHSQFNSSVTLSVGNVKSCKELELIRQQSVLFENELLNGENVDFDLLQQYLIQSVMMGSKTDCELRADYLLLLSAKINLFRNTLKLDGFIGTDRPFDTRFTPDIIVDTSDSNISDINRFYLKKYFITHKEIFEPMSGLKIHKTMNKRHQFTVLQYIYAVKSNSFSSKVDDSVVSNMCHLLYIYDQFIVDTLTEKDDDVDYTNSKVIEIISLLQYRILLYQSLKQQISHITQRDLDLLIRNIHVHYKWFIKHGIKRLIELININKHVDDLHEILAKINSNLTNYFSILKKIAKHYARFDYRSPPVINEFQMDFYDDFNKICKKFDLYDKFESICCILSERNLRINLLQVFKDTSFDMSEVFSSYEDLKIAVDQFNGQIEIPTKEEITVLPVIDFICLLSCYKIRNNLHASTKSLSQCVTVPIKLIGLIERYQILNKDQRNLHEIYYEFSEYFKRSASICPSNFLNYQSEADESEKLESIKLNSYGSVLTFLINKIIVANPEDDEIFSQTSMGNFNKVKHQRLKVLSLLWNNYYQINSGDYDIIPNEVAYIKLSYENFKVTFAKSLDIEDSTIETILRKINSLYDHCVKSQDRTLLIKLLTDLETQYILLNNELIDENKQTNLISNMYILLNYLKILMNTKLSIVDPLTKIGLKKKYCLMEMAKFEKIKTAYKNQCDVVMSSENYVHPYCTEIDKKLADLDKKNLEFGSYVAVRPNNITYDSIYKQISDSLKSVLSAEKFLNIYQESNIYLTKNIQDDTKIFTEIKTLVSNLETFTKQLKAYQYSYPDMIQPILTNLSEISYGLELKLDVMRKVKQEKENEANGFDLNNHKDLLEHLESSIDQISSEKMLNYFRKVLRIDTILEKTQMLRVSVINIKFFYNLCMMEANFSQRINTKLFKQFTNFVEDFINEWKQQEDNRKAKEIEDESLYKTKTKAFEKSDEEQMEDEFKRLFPSFHDKDFSDLQNNTLDDHFDETPDDEANKTNITGVITTDHISSITKMHIDLVERYTKTRWLNPKKTTFKTDSVGLFLDKYKLFAFILEKSVDTMSSNVDRNSLAAVQVFVHAACHFGDTSYAGTVSCPTKISKCAPHNFYKDPKVDDVIPAIFVLEELFKRINELLIVWPEHPVLLDILKIVNRVLNFDITSPLSRFLTGFEILLTKCHEWEENAHSGVSISAHIQTVIATIIQWRKIELNMWKDCLSHTFLRLNEPISKWWCFIYDLMLQFTKCETISNEDLIKPFQTFIFQSNLAEFAGRVNLLKVFHSHVACLEQSPVNDTFMNILWNMYCYFGQFVPNVEAKIKEIRAPIEKKLKDYVKIVRWKDVSYWAIKATLQKTQKTLHKYMKEFEIEIKASANPCFTNTPPISSNTKILDRPPKVYHYTLSPQSYLANKKLVQKISPKTANCTFLNKLAKYFNKSLKICKIIVEAAKYPNLIKQLDVSIGLIISTSEYLQNLEVDRSLEKAKQISQSKGHLQQKQRELATLFKTLTNIGLSYRRGIIQAKSQNTTPKEYLLKPIDLDAALNHLHQHSSFNANDQNILTMWRGVESYYQNSLIQLEILNNSLSKPSKDLGMQNIERCRGFSYDLMHYSIEQKDKLIDSCTHFYNLRYYNTILINFCEGKQFVVSKKIDDTLDIIKQTLLEMEQLKLVLFACLDEPNTSDQLYVDLPILPCENKNFIKYKNDSYWQKANSSMIAINLSCDKICNKIQEVKNYIPSILYENNYLLLNDFDWIFKELQDITKQLFNIQEVFNNVPFGERFRNLLAKYETYILDVANEEIDKVANVLNINNLTKSVLEKSMFILQDMFKKYADHNLTCENQTNIEEGQDDEFTGKLEDNHFKQEIIQSLFDDCLKLQMNKFEELVCNLAKSLATVNPLQAVEIKAIISHVLPCLEQTILLYQYFFTQQVSAYRVSCKLTSILLKIFINLSTNGFCIPQDLAAEMQKEIDGKQSGGMGLAEGEGETDVSERIETEDQLEDAVSEAQEKKKDKEDKQCPEEEKGIEMSDDFDAELQDIDDKKNNSENEQSDNSDAEEQMGDTAENAEQLDQEIWGSDTEEIDEEASQNKDDQKGDKGETLGEEKLAANEERSAGQNQGDKEINEMEEKEYDEDQIDPYHGNEPDLPEPEAFDLPEDMMLDDDGREKENENGAEENPFDIDTMKEQNEQEEESGDQKQIENDEKIEENQSNDESEDNCLEKTEENDQIIEDPDKNQDQTSKTIDQDSVEEDTSENNQQSGLDTTNTNEEAQAMDVDDVQTADNVQATASKNDQSAEPNDQTAQENRSDKDGVGQSQSEEATAGHKGQTATGDISNQKKPTEDDLTRKRQKPGESNNDRTLGDNQEPIKKRLKTMKDGGAEEEVQNVDAEEYQHIRDGKSGADQVLDTATKDQAKEEQSKVNQHRDDAENEEVQQSSEDLPFEDDDEIVSTDQVQKLKEGAKNSDKTELLPTDLGVDAPNPNPIKMDVDGEFVKTQTARRGGESSYYTQHQHEDISTPTMTTEQLLTLKQDIEKQIAEWQQIPSDNAAAEIWEKIKAVTFGLAQNLSEQLRIVLEPTQASRLRGDFRTGRRINMRKVIPYIASQFRKDKIWLRRTKPSKREYQIVLAIDDSSSMHDNHAKEMAFESIAVISKALTLLESGQISVLSFGENTKLVHKLTDSFTDHSGCRLMQEFQFKQNKTCVANLVDFATEMLNSSLTTNANLLLAKLLVIISDGRGIFSEGQEVVRQAVRRAQLSNMFMVFVIVDSMISSESILDIRMTKFDKSGVQLMQYMEEFPFPFYIILQDLNSLPSVLSDALRQWFEVVTNAEG